MGLGRDGTSVWPMVFSSFETSTSLSSGELLVGAACVLEAGAIVMGEQVIQQNKVTEIKARKEKAKKIEVDGGYMY
jgi:hypothetical protein